MDEELRGLAFTTLQALMVDFPEWREDVLSGFVYFIVREVTDVHPTLLDNAVKMLLQLISQWRQAVHSSNKSHEVQVSLFLHHQKIITVKSSEILIELFYFYFYFSELWQQPFSVSGTQSSVECAAFGGGISAGGSLQLPSSHAQTGCECPQGDPSTAHCTGH